MQPTIESDTETGASAHAATLEAMLVQQAEQLGRFFTDAIAKSMASTDSKEAACYGNMALKAHNFCRQLLPAIRREPQSPRALKMQQAAEEETKRALAEEQGKFLNTARAMARDAVTHELYKLSPHIARAVSSLRYSQAPEPDNSTDPDPPPGP